MRPVLTHRTTLAMNVSIHAPVWGATLSLLTSIAGLPVSIHAPVWGCDVPSLCLCSKDISFNPRTRMGATFQHSLAGFSKVCFQSTHPYGVRPFEMRFILSASCSIHAPAWGCDKATIPPTRPRPKFQSTHPHGCDFPLPY